MLKLKVLFVEDNKPLLDNLAEFFNEPEYSCDFAQDGLTALHLLATQHYDVLVFDVLLPGVNGISLCRQVRQQLLSNTPILLLTALDAIDDKSQGFAAGADDYLTKPFDLRELALRIQALARRGGNMQDIIRVADWVYFPGRLELQHANRMTRLNGLAAQLLELLLRAYPNVVSYSEFAERAWAGSEVDENTIRTQIYSLRKQLKQHFGISPIKSIHGRGYQFNGTGDT